MRRYISILLISIYGMTSGGAWCVVEGNGYKELFHELRSFIALTSRDGLDLFHIRILLMIGYRGHQLTIMM